QAGCSRVTHPFATGLHRAPSDLHVLSAPPAFVLSQDQTLQYKETHSALSNQPSNEAPSGITRCFPPPPPGPPGGRAASTHRPRGVASETSPRSLRPELSIHRARLALAPASKAARPSHRPEPPPESICFARPPRSPGEPYILPPLRSAVKGRRGIISVPAVKGPNHIGTGGRSQVGERA